MDHGSGFLAWLLVSGQTISNLYSQLVDLNRSVFVLDQGIDVQDAFVSMVENNV